MAPAIGGGGQRRARPSSRLPPGEVHHVVEDRPRHEDGPNLRRGDQRHHGDTASLQRRSSRRPRTRPTRPPRKGDKGKGKGNCKRNQWRKRQYDDSQHQWLEGGPGPPPTSTVTSSSPNRADERPPLPRPSHKRLLTPRRPQGHDLIVLAVRWDWSGALSHPSGVRRATPGGVLGGR